MDPVIKWAMVAALFMGAGYPLLKIGQQEGINAGWVLVINGLSCIVIGVMSQLFMNYTNRWPNINGISIIVAATLITNIGFFLAMYTFSLKGGLVSVVYVITAIAPLITTIIGLIFLKEAQNVIISRLIFGTILILSGILFVSGSIK